MRITIKEWPDRKFQFMYRKLSVIIMLLGMISSIVISPYMWFIFLPLQAIVCKILLNFRYDKDISYATKKDR